MTRLDSTSPPPPLLQKAPSVSRTLRMLFLTLFTRGRSSRGIQRQTVPKSVTQKLGMTILFYALFGCVALSLVHRPVFFLSVYLHALTFVFLGMFVASAGGEVLFNKEEADILLHRPISSRELLWAKVRMLIEISLWLAAAFNLAGLYVGTTSPDSGWRFPFAHSISTTLEAFFCTGCVILVYQLCLRYFGRERLDSLMTAAQVIVSVAAVLLGQIVPQMMFHIEGVTRLGATSWWVALLPPAWFAGFDDALAGTGARGSWLLGALAVAASVAVSWVAFDRLAGNYEAGLQLLAETRTRKPSGAGGNRRWIDRLIQIPPLNWWLREPVSRASFLLTAAYLMRDRDVKLRVYPGLAPILVLPIIGLFQSMHRSSGGEAASDFQIALSGAFLGVIPLMTLNLLQYSQQWQASDIFRAAPMSGPLPLSHGARRAVLLFIGLPTTLVLVALVWLLSRDIKHLQLLLPGIIAMPVFALVATISGNAIPLSRPTEESKSASRGMVMVGAVMVAMIISGTAAAGLTLGFFWWLILVEFVAAVFVYAILRSQLTDLSWPSME